MLVMENVLRIRREHAPGKAIMAIARDLHLSRKVARKAIRATDADMKYRRGDQSLPKLGPFQMWLDVLLEEDATRPRRAKLQIPRVHDLLLRDGFDGSYDAVRRCATRWRHKADPPPSSIVASSARRKPISLRAKSTWSAASCCS